jgi:hypothetical protein
LATLGRVKLALVVVALLVVSGCGQTDFSPRDGCEISRWQQFAGLLGKRLPPAITG